MGGWGGCIDAIRCVPIYPLRSWRPSDGAARVPLPPSYVPLCPPYAHRLLSTDRVYTTDAFSESSPLLCEVECSADGSVLMMCAGGCLSAQHDRRPVGRAAAAVDSLACHIRTTTNTTADTARAHIFTACLPHPLTYIFDIQTFIAVKYTIDNV